LRAVGQQPARYRAAEQLLQRGRGEGQREHQQAGPGGVAGHRATVARALGVDLSNPLLRAARKRNPALHLARADMRAIPLRDRAMDWALSLFTSFGYFETPEEHAALARELARVARTGVIVDVPNPRFLERNLIEESTRELGERRVEEQRRLLRDPKRVVKRVRILDLDDALVAEYEERVMLFDNSEFIGLFERSGLSLHALHGDYDGSPFEEESSPRQLARFETTGTSR